MPKCPNCYYELVLLEHRRKYKCAKCSKLFPQQEIETHEFKEFNKRERKIDKEEIFGKPQKQAQLTDFERKQRAKQASMKWYQENKEKLLNQKKIYYELHRNTIVNQKRSYRTLLSGQARKSQNEKRKARRYAKIEDTRLIGRIAYWRQQQKQLALLKFENELFNAYSLQSQNLLPTYSLS